VLFGGQGGVLLGDTWEWNGTAWTQVASSGPSPRNGHAMAYDSGRSRVVLFGGRDAASAALSDTWEFDGSTGAWTQRQPAVAPTGRDGHAMAYDVSRSRTVLFGGQTDLSGLSGDTWEWNGTNWSPFLGNGPSARYATAMAYDSGRSRIVLFGGASDVFNNDTWERAGTTWTQITVAAPPQARYFHAMCYDAGRGATVLYSGSNGTRDIGDTWEWRCGTCYPNCDGSSVPPILNVADFICFLNRFGAGDNYANCDGSSVPPVLNVADFICFQNRYAAGCP
jgi:hypothetical protein